MTVWLHVYMQGPGEPQLFGFDTDAEALAFMVAKLKLHHNPGFNPHNGQKTTPIAAIYRCEAERGRGYWWSDPDLKADQGVPMTRFQDTVCLWAIMCCECPDCEPALYWPAKPDVVRSECSTSL